MAIVIREMREADLDEADHVFRLSFGTFLGLPDPLKFAGDSDYVRTRFRANPMGAFVAERDGQVVGSNLVCRWGSVGFFGPLTVHPELWEEGVGQKLLAPMLDLFREWGTTHEGLFTFAQSAKHISLYGKLGFFPRFLTAVMGRPIPRDAASASGWSCFSQSSDSEKAARLAACRELAGGLYPGLDLTDEIQTAADQGLGDTVFLEEGGRVIGFAVCHLGKGTEAGSGSCYVKFGAVASGPEAAKNFERLLDACEALGATRGASGLIAGVNLAREHAYRQMRARGMRTGLQGVAMHRPNTPGYSRPDVFALDDWR